MLLVSHVVTGQVDYSMPWVPRGAVLPATALFQRDEGKAVWVVRPASSECFQSLRAGPPPSNDYEADRSLSAGCGPETSGCTGAVTAGSESSVPAKMSDRQATAARPQVADP